MKKVVNFIIELSDIQKEINDEMIKKYPKTNTVGGYSDLIGTQNLKLFGAKGLQTITKNLSFEVAIENLLYNLNFLNKDLSIKNYINLVERIDKIKNEVIDNDFKDLLLEMNYKKVRSVGFDSFEYKITRIKNHYDSLMFLFKDEKNRHIEMGKFYIINEI